MFRNKNKTETNRKLTFAAGYIQYEGDCES